MCRTRRMNSAWIRSRVCQGLRHMGIEVDEKRNQSASPEEGSAADISETEAPVRILVVPTDEEGMIAKETTAAALALVNEHLGERPIVAVVYSHSHIDHFGGVRGIADAADVRAGKVQIIAPREFMEHFLERMEWLAGSLS